MREGPLVSLIMLTWQHEAWIEAALTAALSQEGAPIEVLLSDDASDDATWDRAQAFAARWRGPAELRLHRHPQNVGAAANFFSAVERARGRLIMTADGDDVCLPGRVARVVQAWRETGALLISHDAWKGLDPLGPVERVCPNRPTGPVPLAEVQRACWQPWSLGATFTLDRAILDRFPPWDPAQIPIGGDHILPFRAALLGAWAWIDEPLIFWRLHPRQLTRSTAGALGDRQAAMERETAYNCTSSMQRLRDLEHLLRAHPGQAPEAWTAARAATIDLAMRWSGAWGQARAALQLNGQALRWTGRGTRA